MGLEDMIEDAKDSKRRREEYRNTFASKSDLKKIEKKLDRTLEETKQNNQQNNTQTRGRAALKWLASGFGNIAQSLNNSSDKRRMRIAQMPGKMSDMDIIRKADVKMLKHPSMRNMDIRGKREKVRSRRGR